MNKASQLAALAQLARTTAQELPDKADATSIYSTIGALEQKLQTGRQRSGHALHRDYNLAMESLGALTGLTAYLASAAEEAELAEQIGTTEDITQVTGRLQSLLEDTNRYLLKRSLTGPHDHRGAVLSLNLGGAIDVQRRDFQERLARAYMHFAETNGFSIESERQGDAVTIAVTGPFAYGLYKGENGTHRFQFEKDSAQHANHLHVHVTPLIEQPEFTINEEDIIIERLGASTKGGSGANTGNQGIRLSYKLTLPDGTTTRIAAESRERSLKQNLGFARAVLIGRIAAAQEVQPERRTGVNRTRNHRIDWNPVITDDRTGVKLEGHEATAFYDKGNLWPFIAAYNTVPVIDIPGAPKYAGLTRGMRN
jgi:peptide chain release factor 2